MIWLKKTVLSCLSLERKSYLKALKYPPAMRNEMLQSCLESENWKKIPEPSYSRLCQSQLSESQRRYGLLRCLRMSDLKQPEDSLEQISCSMQVASHPFVLNPLISKQTQKQQKSVIPRTNTANLNISPHVSQITG